MYEGLCPDTEVLETAKRLNLKIKNCNTEDKKEVEANEANN